jgi:hypothetical protein
MSPQSSLDRENFQTVLANAFAVQESGIDTQSLFAFVRVQRSISTGEPDLDGILHLLADHVRKVANASGVAIALLKAHQLVYRAGNGSAATYIGRPVRAVLSVSAHNESRNEILRVEDARTDARIEAAVCRQFGANSLLILPIYRERGLVGVLEILFDEAHAFRDPELRTYRLMIGLIEEAIFRNVSLDQKKALAIEATRAPHAIEPITPEEQRVPGAHESRPTNAKPGTRPAWGAATALAGELPGASQPSKAATTITLRVDRASLVKLRWIVVATALVIALAIGSWTAYDHRSASRMDASALQNSNAASQHVNSLPVPAVRARMQYKNATRRGIKRLRIRQIKVDQFADDVTIRYFTPDPALPRVQPREKQVDFGEDVTVRYFGSRPADMQQR